MYMYWIVVHSQTVKQVTTLNLVSSDYSSSLFDYARRQRSCQFAFCKGEAHPLTAHKGLK